MPDTVNPLLTLHAPVQLTEVDVNPEVHDRLVTWVPFRTVLPDIFNVTPRIVLRVDVPVIPRVLAEMDVVFKLEHEIVPRYVDPLTVRSPLIVALLEQVNDEHVNPFVTAIILLVKVPVTDPLPFNVNDVIVTPFSVDPPLTDSVPDRDRLVPVIAFKVLVPVAAIVPVDIEVEDRVLVVILVIVTAPVTPSVPLTTTLLLVVILLHRISPVDNEALDNAPLIDADNSVQLFAFMLASVANPVAVNVPDALILLHAIFCNVLLPDTVNVPPIVALDEVTID